MLDWFSVYGGSLLVGTVLIIAVVLIILSLRRDKKRGKSSCGSSCAGCPMSAHCHEKKSDEQ